MKALTVRQPWAWAIAAGYKKVENRVWAPRYRGALLIHAGKNIETEYVDFVARECGVDEQVLLREIEKDLGRFVAICDFYSILPPADGPKMYDPWAVPGMYRWMLRNIRPVQGPVLRGHQGLWVPDQRLALVVDFRDTVAETKGDSR